MQRKVLAIISQHDFLKEKCNEMDDRKKQLNEKLGFLKKQALNSVKELEDLEKKDYSEICDYLDGKGITVGKLDDNRHLAYDLESDALELCVHDGKHPMEQLFNFLMK